MSRWIHRSDGLLAGGLVAITGVEVALAGGVDPLVVAFWVAAAALVLALQAAPRAVAAVAFPLYLVRAPLELAYQPPQVIQRMLWPLVVFGVAAYAPTAFRAWRDGLIAAAAYGAAAAILAATGVWPPDAELAQAVFMAILPATGFVAGIALRDRTAELRAVRDALETERIAGPGRERAAIEAARDQLAADVYTHVLTAIRRLGALADRAAATLRAGDDARGDLTEVQRLSAEAIERLRPLLSVLRDGGRVAEPGGPTEGAGLQAISRLAGPRLAVAVDGGVPGHLRALPMLARRVAEDGAALFEGYGSGALRLRVSASRAGIRLRFTGGGAWWRRGQASLEHERLRQAVAVAGGTLRAPAPWRRRVEVVLPAVQRPEAPPGAGGRRRRSWAALRRSSLVLPVLLAAYGLVEIALVAVPAPLWLRVSGTVVTAAALAGRERAPLACVAVVMGSLLLRQAAGDLGTPTFSQNLVIYVAAFTAGAYARGWRSALGVALVVAGGVAGAIAEPFDYLWQGHAIYALVLLTTWFVGRSVRRIVDASAELRSARSALQKRRRDAVAAAARDDRLNLARELHDVVGHSLTVVAVQAAAAASLSHRDREAALEAVRTVAEHLDAAGSELVQLVRALEPMERRSAPRQDDLERLVDRSRRAGLPVDLDLAADLDAMPPAVRAAAFRIVQEALTNVRRHAGRSATRIRLDHQDGVLVVRVDNATGDPEGPRGLGAGVAGMRERAAALGGTVDAGPAPDGGFRVSAILPLGHAA